VLYHSLKEHNVNSGYVLSGIYRGVNSNQTSAPKNSIARLFIKHEKNKFHIKIFKLAQFLAQMSTLILPHVNPALEKWPHKKFYTFPAYKHHWLEIKYVSK
jgi:hypothetical protein